MFYKFEHEHLWTGPYVQFENGKFLHLDLLGTYTFPVDGWYYFETEEEAKAFFNIND